MAKVANTIAIALMLFFTALPQAHAYLDQGHAKDRSPGNWAVIVLEDIFTFSYSNKTEHLERVRNEYFNASGWGEFKNALDRARILDVLSTNKEGLYSFRYRDQKVEVLEENLTEDKALAQVAVPMTFVYGGGERTGVRAKKTDNLIITLGISGPRTHEREYITDTGKRLPVYEYKIDTYSIRPL